jgi:hypothetical protein
LAQINGDDGNVKSLFVPGKPLDKIIVKRPVGIEEDQTALALMPVANVLPDDVFQEFALSCPGSAADVKVLVPLGARESKGGVPAREEAEIKIVAGSRAHTAISSTLTLL